MVKQVFKELRAMVGGRCELLLVLVVGVGTVRLLVLREVADRVR